MFHHYGTRKIARVHKKAGPAITKGIASGKALDIAQSMPVAGASVKVIGTDDFLCKASNKGVILNIELLKNCLESKISIKTALEGGLQVV